MKWLLVIVLAVAISLAYLSMTKAEAQVIDDADVNEGDVEALARMIASENPNDKEIVQVAICWTAKNMATRRRIAVRDLVMPGGIPKSQAGRYASTVNPGTDKGRAIARNVMSGRTPDPTGGAVQFDAPKTQDILYAQGTYSKNADDIAEERQAEGKVEVHLPGVDPYYMRWWRYA